jgi:hypothetical protein
MDIRAKLERGGQLGIVIDNCSNCSEDRICLQITEDYFITILCRQCLEEIIQVLKEKEDDSIRSENRGKAP